MNHKTLYIAAFIILLISACTSSGKKVAAKKNKEMTVVPIALCDSLFAKDADEMDKGAAGFDDAQEVFYRFPSPDEMLNFINHKQYYFNDRLLSDPANTNNYLDSKSQALNLGIYLGDLAYATLFERHRDALGFFKAVHELSDKLRISPAFDPGIISSLENNLDNIDSLKSLIDESQTQIVFYLEKENKGKELAIISIGGFVEALYLAFNLVDEYSADNIIIQRITDQKLVLENIIKYICADSGDENVAYAVDLILPIFTIYNNLDFSTTGTRVGHAKDGKLILGGGTRTPITEEKYKELESAVFTAREKIIGN